MNTDRFAELVKLLPARAKVILASALTYITLAQTALLWFSDDIVELLPLSAAETASKVVLRVLAVLGAIILMIRRSIPAEDSQKGLLTPPPKADVDVPVDRGAVNLQTVVYVLVAILAVVLIIHFVNVDVR